MPEGKKKYIEVKTTTGGKESDFFITANEVQFAKQHPENFYLYRVYEYDEKSDSGKFFVLRGPLKDSVGFFPVQYRVKVKSIQGSRPPLRFPDGSIRPLHGVAQWLNLLTLITRLQKHETLTAGLRFFSVR